MEEEQKTDTLLQQKEKKHKPTGPEILIKKIEASGAGTVRVWHESYKKKFTVMAKMSTNTRIREQKTLTGRAVAVIWDEYKRYVGICLPSESGLNRQLAFEIAVGRAHHLYLIAVSKRTARTSDGKNHDVRFSLDMRISLETQKGATKVPLALLNENDERFYPYNYKRSNNSSTVAAAAALS